MATTSPPTEFHAPKRSAAQTWERLLPAVLLSPSVIALAIFVYGFIGVTFWISISNWKSNIRDMSIIEPITSVYDRLFSMTRFQIDIRNTLIFTVLLLVLAVGLGLLFAVLLDQNIPMNGLFRNIFLFPYALSFVVTGVAWRWIFNPETGLNLLVDKLGVNWLLGQLGFEPWHPLWTSDPTVVGDLGALIPLPGGIRAQLGIPLALLPVVIAAVWQLSGFAMAMYISGLAAIPEEIREAGALDGASTIQMYRDLILPQLRPITISTMIILGHVSLKIFDLVYAMSGSGPGYATDVPGIFMFEQTFRATRYNLGAAASVVMLVFVAIVIVPYLARSLKEQD